MANWLSLGLNLTWLCLEFRVFSHAHQVFDEMLERAFILVYGQLTYAERWGQLSSVGSENGKYLDMKIVQVLVRSLIANLVV